MLNRKHPKMKLFTLFLMLGLFSFKAIAQQDTSTSKNQRNLYTKGVKAPASNFTGTVWVNMLVTPQDQLDSGVGSVTFEPGARTNWHMHPGGQALLVTEGKGLYQEKGGPVRVIKKGEVIICPPGTAHWHGATPKNKLTHIAISTNGEKGPAVWLQKVTDEEYHNFKY
jgi:quercetin dioxygenase-like cupin family protein